MTPITFQTGSTPQPHDIDPLDDRISFFERLHPFIQLLLAIGNAILLPSCFVFSHLFFWKTKEQKVFAQTIPQQDPPKIAKTIPVAVEKEHKRIQYLEPLKLQDLGKNSCYLDSVLQALFCIDEVCKGLSEPVLEEEKWEIQKELVQFLKDRKTVNDLVPFEGLPQEAPSINRLKNAIFKSGLDFEFTMSELEKQHDAADAMSFIFNQFLSHFQIMMQVYNSTDDFPGLEFKNHVTDKSYLFQVPFRDTHSTELKDFINWVLSRHYERSPRSFDPASGTMINRENGLLSKSSPPKMINKYVQWNRFKEIPPVVCLHLVRFDNGFGKNEREVTLPKDGIVDLEKYTDPHPDGTKHAKYRIKSYVVHSGSSLYNGHYRAYVEYNGKYFCCDDQNKNSFKEISKEEFFDRNDAYLIVMEKI